MKQFRKDVLVGTLAVTTVFLVAWFNVWTIGAVRPMLTTEMFKWSFHDSFWTGLANYGITTPLIGIIMIGVDMLFLWAVGKILRKQSTDAYAIAKELVHDLPEIGRHVKAWFAS